MLQFANQRYRIKRGSHKGSIIRILSLYKNRKLKIQAVTDKLLKGKEVNARSVKRKLVVSAHNLVIVNKK